MDQTSKDETSSADSESFNHIKLDAVIVGASWAGMWSLHLLKQKGLNARILDNQKEIGGTWCYTKYPGCRVDTEVPLYEFSEPDLWKNWNWTERFPSGEEIYRYLSWVCDRLHLRQDIDLHTRVLKVTWNEETHRWRVLCNNSHSNERVMYDAKYFIGGAGYATIPHTPPIPGLEKFPNRYHTSRWPEGLDLSGKRVGVIGTGASGLQCIEQLAPKVKHLTVFQKSPNLATPTKQRKFTPQEMQEWKEKNYAKFFKSRVSQTGFHTCSNRETDEDPNKRREFYEDLWTRGGLAPWLGNYSDLLYSRTSNQYMYDFWREKVLQRVKDPITAEKLAPKKPPYAFGTKRPSLETTYFDTFNLPNVELVDLTQNPILKATPEGLQTSKFHALDAIVLATGFDFVVGSLLAMDIQGAGGMSLKDQWNTNMDGNGIRTHLGLMTSNFPNFFFLLGPQSPAGLGITPHMCEIQGAWIANCIHYMLDNGYSRAEPSLEAENEWTTHVFESSQSSLLAETNSWWFGANLPDRKKQPLCYTGRIDDYQRRLAEDSFSSYTSLCFEKSKAKQKDAFVTVWKNAWMRFTSLLPKDPVLSILPTGFINLVCKAVRLQVLN